MVTEKTGLSLHNSWRNQHQRKIATLRQAQGTFPAESLLLKYSLFTFYLLRRVIKAGLLIVREELLWLVRER